MATSVIRLRVHDREVEVACYGSELDWVCRLTDPCSQLEHHCDAYCPPPDLGFVWFRDSDGNLLASGLVNREVFQNTDAIDKLLYGIAKMVMRRDDSLATCIEFFGVEFTATFDGEQGAVQHEGNWQESRWWQPATGAKLLRGVVRMVFAALLASFGAGSAYICEHNVGLTFATLVMAVWILLEFALHAWLHQGLHKTRLHPGST